MKLVREPASPSNSLRAALVCSVILVITIACGSNSSSGTPVPSIETSTPTAAPDPSPVSGVRQPPTATPSPYDTERIMYRLFMDTLLSPGRVSEALDQIRANGDVSLVPVIVETMRFVFLRELQSEFASALRDLTGNDMEADGWHEWAEWLGKHRDEFPPPEQYAEWKRQSLSRIHPRFVELLGSAEDTSRIELTEVVWGGVSPDGIPDLQDPPSISADEASYLLPDDRVVGVTIDDESRAYPLRILNPHEMVNDVLGGEPISLVW